MESNGKDIHAMLLTTKYHLLGVVLQKNSVSVVQVLQASEPETFYLSVSCTIYMSTWTRVRVSQFLQVQSRGNEPLYQAF